MKIMSIIAVVTILAGCSTGRFVCEWQTEDEQLLEIINETLEQKTQQEKVRQAELEEILQQARGPNTKN